MGWSCTAEQSKALEKVEKAIRSQADYNLTPPKPGLLIDLFDANGRDFGNPPHLNMRIKIERISSSYQDEKKNWHSYTNPVGFITIEPDGKMKFSSKHLQSEMFRNGLEAA